MARAKHWCFTLNNPAAEEVPEWPVDVEYYVIGIETGDSGTPHWQGYVCFKKQLRLTQLKKLMPRAHWEVMRGTPQQASDYCKKDGNYQEDGTLPLTGAQAANAKGANKKGGETTKRRYEAAKELAMAGNIEDIDADIYIRHYNTLKRIKTDHQEKIPPIETLLHEWHYGPTGTGKSRFVREKYPEAFIKDANKWWDGYNGEDVVIIEDIDKYDIKLGRHLKLWGDHYAFPADMKNQGKLDIRPKKVIITSNYAPREIWDDEKTYEPIERRYKLIEYK